MMMPSTVLMIVRPPGEPRTRTGLPAFATMVGDMLESIRFPGATRFGFVPMSPFSVVRPARGLKSPISLLSRKPAPGTTMREP